MIINNVVLENFRNYNNINMSLKSGLNIFIGNNAQGKTNLLESIYLCSIGKSTRTTKDKDLINWQQDRAKITVNIFKNYSKSRIDIILTKKDKKTVKINNIPIKRLGELMGELTVIYFSPDEIRLIKDAPQDRRRFMDIDISQMSKTYFYLLCRYEKVLNQRNKLLKITKSTEALKDSLNIWDEQLSDIASKIVLSRINFINELKKPAQEVHSQITSGEEKLEISYVGTTGSSAEEIKTKLLKGLKDNIVKDHELGFTTIGPHRDDIKVMINNIDVRSFGSQGQQRLATLSLKIAELELFKKREGEAPVLLLDDVLSELDEQRQLKLLDKIKGYQTIITCTKFNYKLSANDAKFIIAGGKVHY